MKYGIFNTEGLRRKPRLLINSIYEAGVKAGYPVEISNQYINCDVLILYGWGGAKQQRAMRDHKGPYVALDLGYWDRAGLESRYWRVSINGFHCPDLIMKGPMPPERRWQLARKAVAKDRPPVDGPILMIGNAPKSQAVVGKDWAAKKSREIRKLYPKKEIIYRSKPGRAPEGNVLFDKRSDIADIRQDIARAEFVLCRHSNVAVDCCLDGVPVVCEDGAASSIYPSDIRDYKNQPTIEQRKEFLTRLAWWQWNINEINKGLFWPWLESQLAKI